MAAFPQVLPIESTASSSIPSSIPWTPYERRREFENVVQRSKPKRVADRAIITVGLDGDSESTSLISLLTHRGLEVVGIADPKNFDEILQRYSKATVLIYVREHGDRAHAVLRCLDSCFRKCPVVVIVKQGSRGEYEELMLAGANYYYELSEGPETISRAVLWADRQAA